MADPSRRPRDPGAYLRLPLWQRYVLSGLVGVALMVALVVYVSGHNTDSPPSTNPAAQVQANRQAEILVAQDQSPRVVRLPSGQTSRVGFERALTADLKRRIARGQLSGPLRRVRCRASGPRGRSARAFSCTAVAGSVSYPFLGVVDQRARRITYCKRDPPPAPSDNVPVSRRCRS